MSLLISLINYGIIIDVSEMNKVLIYEHPGIAKVHAGFKNSSTKILIKEYIEKYDELVTKSEYFMYTKRELFNNF